MKIFHSIRSKKGYPVAAQSITGTSPLLAWVDTTYSLPTGGTTWTPVDATEFQTALDDCEPGDVIILEANTAYTGNFTVWDKGPSDEWIYVISSSLASLPEGQRVALSDSGYMPNITDGDTGQSAHSVLFFDFSAARYRFVGLNINTGAAKTSTVRIGYGLTGPAWYDNAPASGVEQLQSDIIFDRCLVHSTSDVNRLRHGFLFNGIRCAIIDSYIANCKDSGSGDSNAITIANGGGPYKIHNCFLEATTENVLIGGTVPKISGAIPSDIEFSHNHCYKREVWKDPDLWSVKNIFETKNVQRLHIYGCVFENSWSDSQVGYGVYFKVASQGDTAPQSCCHDILMENCVQRNAAYGLTLLTDDDSHPSDTMERVTVRNCLFQEISRHATKTGDGGASNRLVSVSVPANSGWGSGVGRPVYGFYVEHCTFMYDLEDDQGGYAWFSTYIDPPPYHIDGGYYRYNLTGHGTYQLDLDRVNDFAVSGNLVVFDPDETNYSFNWSNLETRYPLNNEKSLLADVGFEDISGIDFRLANTSPYKNGAPDGLDYGVIYSELISVISQYDNSGIYPF